MSGYMCGVKSARRPELAAEVKYLTWTGDNLLRQVVYERLREDKPAAEVRREVPIGKPRRRRRVMTPLLHSLRAIEPT